jgi:Fe-S-cluster formation regulator IscX/YfhJ
MINTVPKTYDPREFRALTFHDAVARFRDGSDTPRAYLERCLEAIEEREPIVRAFAALNPAGARAAADESATRWKAGHPRSPIESEGNIGGIRQRIASSVGGVIAT